VAGIWGQARNSADRAFDPPDLPKAPIGRSGLPGRLDVGTDTKFQIWGQTRCPVCRLGTFKVQRSTLNVQRGDRKGACWAEYGDRHDVWAVGRANRGTDTIFVPGERTFGRPDLSKSRSESRSRLRHPDMGTDTVSGMPTRNV